MLKDWPNRTVAAVAIMVTALSVAVALVWRSVAWGIVCFLMLFGLAILLQPWFDARRSATRKKRDAEQLAVAKIVEAERIRPDLAAWESFLTASSDLEFYELRGPAGTRDEPVTDAEWRAWRGALDKLRTLADSFEAPSRLEALQFIEGLAEVPRDDMDAGSQLYDAFNDWMMARNVAYVTARRRLGLPLPDRSRST
jgi:hypothetical protein